MNRRIPRRARVSAAAFFLCAIAGFLNEGRAADEASKTAQPEEMLRLTLRTDKKIEVLGSWSREDLLKLKQSSLWEKDPGGVSGLWQGVRITDLINPVLERSSAVQAAKVDLLVLKNKEGVQTILPRSFINKYPILLAMKRDSKQLENLGSIYSVVPKADSTLVRSELLPVESYFVPGLVEIELGNYRQQFSGVFLKRRSDPKGMRGERLFVKTCMGCHGASGWPMPVEASKGLLSGGGVPASHLRMSGVPKLSKKDQVGLESYFKALQGERPDLASGNALAKDEG